MSGCGSESNGKTVVPMLQYKPEAVKAFETIERGYLKNVPLALEEVANRDN